MIIVNKTDLSVVSVQEFRQAHRNISFPSELTNGHIASTGYEIINEPEFPALAKYQHAELGLPYKQGNQIKVDWVITTTIPPLDVIKKEFETAIDELLNKTAKAHRYDSTYTMISYLGDPNPIFDREARSMFVWRSAVWTKANQLLTGFAGEDLVDLPTVEDVLALLPEFTLLDEA